MKAQLKTTAMAMALKSLPGFDPGLDLLAHAPPRILSGRFKPSLLPERQKFEQRIERVYPNEPVNSTLGTPLGTRQACALLTLHDTT